MEGHDHPFLSGNYAPVLDELDIDNLDVIGAIPKELHGVYMRNGPNPAYPPVSYTFPFDGDGMVHAVYIADGKAHYRNRFVQTAGLKAERRAGKALYGGILHPTMPDAQYFDSPEEVTPFKNGAFIHVIRHGGRYLAMHEAEPAYEINIKLETLGIWCPGTKEPIKVAPHTRLCPITGDLWLINYDLEPPFMSIYRVNPSGQLQDRFDIDKSYCSMMHDFVLTKNYVIFFDTPVVLDGANIGTDKSVIDWRPELGVNIGIMPKKGGKIRWHQTDPFFVFHFSNAFEENNEIVIDYVRHSRFKYGDEDASAGLPPTSLYRTRINLHSQSVKHKQLDDCPIEFPRIREDRDTLPYHITYTAGKTSSPEEGKAFNAVIKYNVSTHSSEIHDFGKTCEVGEAVFVPKPNSSKEDEGYLMVFVYHKKENNTEFVILDAEQMSSSPLARVKMPRRIPHGLHGSWMDGPWEKE